METTAPIAMTGRLEPRESWVARHCSMEKALGVVRTRSAFLILREAYYGATRFEEFAARAQLSDPVTAQRLRELASDGLLVREPYREPGQRTRDRYRLTEMGAELMPALVALMQWGDRWLQEDGAPVVLEHHGCGEPVAVHLRCAAGHEVVPGEIDLVNRPRSAQGP